MVLIPCIISSLGYFNLISKAYSSFRPLPYHTWLRTSNLLHRLGKFDKASVLLLAAKDAVFTDDARTIEKANLWRVIGKNYDYLGQNQEAAAAFCEASEMLRVLGQLESHDGAALLTCVAANLQEGGQVEEALANYRKAWEIRQACGSERSLDA